MSNLLLMVDNSNIHVQTMKLFGSEARFSYIGLEKCFYGDNNIIEKHIVGSTPPSTDAFWDRMRQNGYIVRTYERKVDYSNGGTKEKGVDGAIITRGTEAIIKHKPDILVLLSGDLDMRSLVEIAKEYNCIVHIWAYSKSSSRELENISNKIFYIDEHLEDLIYFQYSDGHRESFAEHNKKLAEEELERRLAEEDLVRTIETSFQHREIDEASQQETENQKKKWPTWKKALVGTGAVLVTGAVAIPLFLSGKSEQPQPKGTLESLIDLFDELRKL